MNESDGGVVDAAENRKCLRAALLLGPAGDDLAFPKADLPQRATVFKNVEGASLFILIERAQLGDEGWQRQQFLRHGRALRASERGRTRTPKSGHSVS